MPNPPNSHFSPVFANRPWANADGYSTYYWNPYTQRVAQGSNGPRQWGRKRGLYTWRVENALNSELETDAAQVYQSLLSFKELDELERVIWAQYLLSQICRTPTFIKYEKAMRELHGVKEQPANDRVGCKDCGDLALVTSRDWCLMVCHPKEYFVRSDNPVLLSGFLERPETFLLYPLSPRLCFVACSMPEKWNACSEGRCKPEFFGKELDRGSAFFFNFHLARAAGQTLILNPGHDGEVAESLFGDILGLYPQPPFMLQKPTTSQMEIAFDNIRLLMGHADQTQYPHWLPMELEPIQKRG